MATAIPTTPQTILQEDGAEVALVEFADEVRAGEDAIRRVVAAAPAETVWTIRELRDAAAEGRRSSVMSVALMGLDKAGEVQVDYASSTVAASS